MTEGKGKVVADLDLDLDLELNLEGIQGKETEPLN